MSKKKKIGRLKEGARKKRKKKKWRMMRWAGNVAPMSKMRNVRTILFENLKGRYPVGDQFIKDR
jgi:hypothetical protein